MVTNNLRTTLESTKQRASLAESTKLKSTLVTLEEVPGGVPYFSEAGLAADLSTKKISSEIKNKWQKIFCTHVTLLCKQSILRLKNTAFERSFVI